MNYYLGETPLKLFFNITSEKCNKASFKVFTFTLCIKNILVSSSNWLILQLLCV